MSADLKITENRADKSQENLVHKFNTYLKIVLDHLEPGSKSYKEWRKFQNAVEKHSTWFCYGFVVNHAVGYLPENIQRGAADIWDSRLYHIATWNGNEEDLDHLIFLGNSAPATTVRENLNHVINAIFPAQLNTFSLTSIDSPFQNFSQRNPEKHISISLPKLPSSEPLLSAEQRITRIGNQYSIAGYFTEKDLILSLDDAKTQSILSKNICIIANDFHTAALRYDLGKMGWFLYDSDYDETVMLISPRIFKNEKFFPDTPSLARYIINKGLGETISLNVWQLTPNHQTTIAWEPYEQPFSYFYKVLATHPETFMINNGLAQMLSIKSFYERNYSILFKALQESKGFSLITQLSSNPLHISALIQASYNNDEKLMRLFLSRIPEDEKIRSSKFSSALMGAATNGNENFVKIFLARGQSINKPDRCGNTALIRATIHQHKEVVEILLANHAEVDWANLSGWTALACAAEIGNLDILKMLIAKDANIDIRNNFSQTPLMLACIYGHSAIVEYLIQYSADFTLIDIDGCTAMDLAAENGHFEICEILATAMINVDREQQISRSIQAITIQKDKLISWHATVRGDNDRSKKPLPAELEIMKQGNFREEKSRSDGILKAIINGDERVVEVLLNQGHSPEQYDEYDNSALMLAVIYQRKGIVAKLLDKNANVETGNCYYWTALACAAATGQLDTLEMLIAKGANVNIGTNFGQTPLMLACIYGHSALVKSLLKHNLDFTLIDQSDSTALDLAAKNGYFEIYELLADAMIQAIKKEQKEKFSPSVKAIIQQKNELIFRQAAKQGDGDTFEQYLSKEIDIEQPDSKGRTAAQLAARRGQFEICAKLFKIQLSLNTTSAFRTSPPALTAGELPEELPLVYDVESHFSSPGLPDRKEEVTQDGSIDKSALLRFIDAQLLGNKPLLIKVAEGLTTRALKWLLQNFNLDILVSDDKGRTALMEAVARGDAEMVRFLVGYDNSQEKLSLRTSAKNGDTVLLLAIKSGRLDIVSYLIESGATPGTLELLEGIKRRDYRTISQLLATDVAVEPAVVRQALEAKHFQIAQLLLNKLLSFEPALEAKGTGALVKKPSLLLWAIANLSPQHSPAIVQSLLEANADEVDNVDEKGMTALMTAVVHDNLKLVQVLLDANASVYLKNNQKQNPLGLAIENNLEEMIELLLKNYVPPDLRDSKLNSTASQKDNKPIVAKNLFKFKEVSSVTFYRAPAPSTRMNVRSHSPLPQITQTVQDKLDVLPSVEPTHQLD